MAWSKIGIVAAAVLLLLATAVLSVAVAGGGNNGKACNTTASCVGPCVRVPYGLFYMCGEAEAHKTPGKVCGNGTDQDNCLDNASARCGMASTRRCSGPPNPPECDPKHKDEASIPGCLW